jgi:hypothetical protein
MATTQRITSDSQAGFIGALLLGALFVAVGSSITMFALTSTLLATLIDQLLALATGLLLLVVGAGVGYRTLA